MGRTGLRVSTICLGTMTFGFQTDQPTALRILDTAWEAGVNFLDTSDVYPLGSDDTGTTEEIIGSWLKRMPRDRVVVATKARGATGPGPNDVGLSRKHILSAVDASHAWEPIYRPLPDPLPRPRHPDGGDDAGRSRTSCAGARCATSAARTTRSGSSRRRSP